MVPLLEFVPTFESKSAQSMELLDQSTPQEHGKLLSKSSGLIPYRYKVDMA